MIKTSTIPKNTSVQVIIPDHYIGKNVEILIYSIEELKGNATQTISKKRQFGSAKNKYKLATDFNEILDDFKEYI